MDLGLEGRRALVIGASRGLGAAIAQTLLQEKASVIAAARDMRALAEWIDALPAEERSRVLPFRLDLADIASVEALASALNSSGGVDIVIGNSGGPPPSEALTARRDAWLSHFEAMAANLFHLVQQLLPRMLEKQWGRIITIASSGVEQPIPNLALSNGVRSAVVGWSKTLATEVAAGGVTVNVVLPGRIHTDRVDRIDAAAAERNGTTREDVVKASLATIPAGRYGSPREFADVVVFLASERAAYLTGSKIRVDGGLIRGI